MNHFRVTVVGSITGKSYSDQFRNQEDAEMLFDRYVNGPTTPMWKDVTLSTWVEGAGFWYTMRTQELQPHSFWQNSPVTHSYV